MEKGKRENIALSKIIQAVLGTARQLCTCVLSLCHPSLTDAPGFEWTPCWFFASLPSVFKLSELVALTKHVNLVLLLEI